MIIGDVVIPGCPSREIELALSANALTLRPFFSVKTSNPPKDASTLSFLEGINCLHGMLQPIVIEELRLGISPVVVLVGLLCQFTSICEEKQISVIEQFLHGSKSRMDTECFTSLIRHISIQNVQTVSIQCKLLTDLQIFIPQCHVVDFFV